MRGLLFQVFVSFCFDVLLDVNFCLVNLFLVFRLGRS